MKKIFKNFSSELIKKYIIQDNVHEKRKFFVNGEH